MAKRVLLVLGMLSALLAPGLLWAQTAADADFDGDGKIGFSDFLRFARAYGSAEAQYDLNGDGAVGFPDFLAFVRFYGQDVVVKPAGPVHLQALTDHLPGKAPIEFIWIEPGTFTMGSPDSEPGRYSVEGPQHEVTITKGFYLGKYEVTQGQWEAVTGDRPWVKQSYVLDRPDHPAAYVSTYDIEDFIHALNVAAGDSLYRLPTEAEWEYACRAETTTIWSFGDDREKLDDYCWYRDNTWDEGEQYAHKVGQKKPNPWGFYDMHGNVYELVFDWYGPYSPGPQVDPEGPPPNYERRAMRGGAFNTFIRNTRSAERYWCKPWDRLRGTGFRLLRRKP